MGRGYVMSLLNLLIANDIYCLLWQIPKDYTVLECRLDHWGFTSVVLFMLCYGRKECLLYPTINDVPVLLLA